MGTLPLTNGGKFCLACVALAPFVSLVPLFRGTTGDPLQGGFGFAFFIVYFKFLPSGILGLPFCQPFWMKAHMGVEFGGGHRGAFSLKVFMAAPDWLHTGC